MSAAVKQISNVTAEEDYVDALTIYNDDVTFTSVFLQIYNAAVWYSIATGPGAAWGSDTFLGPVIGTLALPPCSGIRFKFVDPAAPQQAQVSATMLTDAEAPNAVTSLAPTTAIVNTEGGIIAGDVVAVAVQGTPAMPGSPWAVRLSNGAVFVDTVPVDVIDRIARELGHVIVDALPTVTLDRGEDAGHPLYVTTV